MKKILRYIPIFMSVVLASVYIFPIFSKLILLPLDLLVSNSNPWNMAGTILLKNPYMQDSIIQMFPWKHMTYDALMHSIIPLWNPYQFMGMPFMASMKPMVFYPANILFLFGEANAWNLLLWGQLFLSLYFTYLFVHSLGVKSIFAFFSAITFAFNSLMMSVLQFGSEGHVLLWLPMLLYCTRQFIALHKSRYLLGISVGIACSIFAGHLQYFAYVALLLVVFLYYESAGSISKKHERISVLLFICIGIGISAVQSIPGIELFTYSYRGLADNYGVFANGLLQPHHLLRLLSPDWFGNPVTRDLTGGYIESSGYLGIVPLFFSYYAFIQLKKNRYVIFFGLVALISLLFSLNGIAQILYFLHIPLITSGFGGRLFSITLFSLSIVSAFGLLGFVDTESPKEKSKHIVIFTMLVLGLYGIGLVLHRYGLTTWVSISNIKIQIVLTVILLITSLVHIRLQNKRNIYTFIFLCVVIAASYGDLFRMGYRFLTFSNEKFLYPIPPVVDYIRKDSEKTLGRAYGLTEPEIYGVFKVYNPETYNPLYPLRTAKLLQALENTSNMPMPINKFYLTKNPRMKYVMDFLGVSYIVPGKGKNPATELWNDSSLESQLIKVYEDEYQDVYKNIGALPRFGLFYSVRENISDEESLRIITDHSIDFSKQLLLSDSLRDPVKEGTGSVRLISSDMNSMSFEVSSTTPALLYLSDTFFPGWHATVNAIDTEIYRANYNFRAVRVPAGSSTVSMWYLPNSVVMGGAMSGSSLLILLFVLIYYNTRKQNGT